MKNLLLIAIIVCSAFAKAQTEMPDLTLKNISGEEINLQDLNKDGNVAVVSIWATWCVNCIRELDAIADVYSEWQEETNLTLYAITIDDARARRKVPSFVNGRAWEYEVLYDPNSDFVRFLGSPIPPVTLIIKDGKIVYQHTGYTPGAEDELYEKIKSYATN